MKIEQRVSKVASGESDSNMLRKVESLFHSIISAMLFVHVEMT